MRPTHRVALAMTIAVACGGDDDAPDVELVTVVTVPGELNRALDLLLVIDDSGGMAEEQAMISARLPRLFSVLATAPGGLPDVHIGVVSTDVGTGGVEIGGCSSAARPDGDDGLLQTSSWQGACAGAPPSYLEDLSNPDGTRARNYAGDLSSVLGCMVRLGTTGCSFEQPLESMKRALSPGRNPGFLRPDALLAVLILTTEDDCSALPGGAMFGDPNATLTSPLGPRTSFRCFEFGVQCENDPDPRSFGTKAGCVPRVGSPHMPTVQPYIDAVRGLKADPRSVVVGVIAGDVDFDRTAVIGSDSDVSDRPRLQPSCSGIPGDAVPGLRLQSFLEGFPDRSFGSSICNEDQGDALAQFGRLVRHVQGNACIGQPLADVDAAQPGLQPRCEVTEYTVTAGVRSDPVAISACGGGASPCWELVVDPIECSDVPDALKLGIVRTGAAPAGTEIEARCQIVP